MPQSRNIPLAARRGVAQGPPTRPAKEGKDMSHSMAVSGPRKSQPGPLNLEPWAGKDVTK